MYCQRLLSVSLLLLVGTSVGVFAQQGAGAIVAIAEGAGGPAVQQGSGRTTSGTAAAGGSGKKASTPSRQSGGKASAKAPTSTSSANSTTSHPAPKPKPYNGPILGDKYSFLNFEVAEAVQPVHTNAAKAAGAKGLVQVEILVDTDGRVIAAHARTGNKLLWPEAERAALATRLNRPTVYNQPARAMGFLVYRFGPADDDDD